MLRQFLMIGLGGSGGKTLRYTKQSLEEWLKGIGWDEGIPTGWQFLHIDTPSAQDSPVLPGHPELLPADEYFSMYQSGVTFPVIADSLKTKGTNFDGWWVDPIRMQVPIQSGAGQYRAVGRVVALERLTEISARLKGKIAQMNQANSTSQLRRVETQAFGTTSDDDHSPMVFIVSSLAGGTGAALIADIADELRSFGDPWLSTSFGVLYAADVFQYLSDQATAGIQPNAAAAIAELSHGSFGGGGFTAVGGARLASMSGPKFPFLVGHENASGVVFGDQVEVYRVIGRGLAAIMSEPSLQDQLDVYMSGNWETNAHKYPGSGGSKHMLLDAHSRGVFQGMGYAEVELGVERFATYSSQRIARDAIDWLLNAHETISDGQQRFADSTPDQVIATLAEDSLARFLTATELDERGPDANMVIDGINPESEGQRIFRTFVSDLQSDVLDVDWRRAGTDEWVDLVVRSTEMRYGGAIEEYDRLLRTEAKGWSERLFESIQIAIETVVAQQGLVVAEALVSRVIEDLTEAAKELDSERNEWAVQSGYLRTNINAGLDHLGGGNLHRDAPEILDACNVAAKTAVFYRMEEKRCLVGAALIVDLVPHVLVPLATAMRDARERLSIEILPGAVTSKPIDFWPRNRPKADQDIPEGLRPGGSVASVIDPDDYAELFDSLLEKSVGDAAETQDHRYRVAREDTIRGRFIDDQPSVKEEHHRLPAGIKVLDVWVPDERLLVGGRPQQPARFDFKVERDDILHRAEAWVFRDGYAFERFLGQGLRDFLSEDPRVSARELFNRQEAFMAALERAFRASAPLVNIDEAAVAMIHSGGQVSISPTPSEIPLLGHDLEERVRLFTHTMMTEGQKPTFTQSSRTTRISIFATLDGALHPAAFESIAAPIADAWRDAIRTDNLENFWRWRRARPLAEAVPVPRDTLRALIRGWFTANALGLLESEPGSSSVALDTLEGRVVSPKLLCSPGPQMYELLGSLVETLAVALPTAAHSKRFDEYLGIYESLIDLGTSARAGSAPSEYLAVNQSIVTWVETGRPWNDHDIVRPELTDRAQRIEFLSNLYRSAIDQYGTLADNARERGHINQTFGWLGLVPVIQAALADLVAAIEQMNITEVGV